MMTSVSLEDVKRAAERLKPFLKPTPMIDVSSQLGRRDGFILAKLECLQPISVFKIRGALNKLLSLSEAERGRGIVTASSGNHGIAVSYAARKFAAPCHVFVPKGANPKKVQAIRRWGATMHFHGKDYQEAADHAIEFCKMRNAVFVHAYDDPDVIAGQGTIALEILSQEPAASAVIVPVGGGGLVSGISLTAKAINPSVRIIGVQSRSAPAVFRSWKAGKVVPSPVRKTVADGLASRRPSELTLSFIRQYVNEMYLLSDTELIRAARRFYDATRIMLEPSGAAGVGAFLFRYDEAMGQRVVVVASGSNISNEAERLVMKLR